MTVLIEVVKLFDVFGFSFLNMRTVRSAAARSEAGWPAGASLSAPDNICKKNPKNIKQFQQPLLTRSFHGNTVVRNFPTCSNARANGAPPRCVAPRAMCASPSSAPSTSSAASASPAEPVAPMSDFAATDFPLPI
jgi:hypothetical protein